MPLTREGRFYLLFIFITTSLFIDNYSNESVLFSLIWVYNVNTKSLVEGAPFKTKAECSRAIPILSKTIKTPLEFKI